MMNCDICKASCDERVSDTEYVFGSPVCGTCLKLYSAEEVYEKLGLSDWRNLWVVKRGRN